MSKIDKTLEPKLRALIIEDSAASQTILKNLLDQFCNDKIIIVDSAKSCKEGIQAIKTNKPDVVFLEIDLPDGTGFDVLKNIQSEDRNFAIICTTECAKNSLRALKEGVIDCLTKPIEIGELQIAVAKALRHVEKEFYYKHRESNKTLIEYFHLQHINKPKIVLSNGTTHRNIETKDIIYCKSAHKYTLFYTITEGILRVRKNLSDYEDFLIKNGFARINRSTIINLTNLLHWETINMKTDAVTLSDGSTVKISPAYKDVLLNKFDTNKKLNTNKNHPI